MAAATLLCAGFVSCSQDELVDMQGEPLPQGKYPLELTAGGLQALSAPTSAPSARGTADDNWDDVSDVAVQVGGIVKKYSVAAFDGSNASLTSDAPFYWQTSDEVMNITAWYPCSDACPDPATWTVKADQSDAADYQASDFIRGNLTLKFADRNNSDKNQITFNHQTAKVFVMLNSENVTLDKNTSVKLLNVSGVEGGGTDITCHRPDDGQQHYSAILPPQTISGGTPFIQVSVGGNDFFYTPSNSKSMTSGHIYRYVVRVKATGIEVSEVTGGIWTDGGSENVSSTDNTQE